MVQFFRSRQGDDRRRRVVADEGTGAAGTPVAKSTAANRSSARRYPAESLREHQPRLIDFIPQKLPKLILLLALGLTVIAGIEAAYATNALRVAEHHLPTFDLTAEGSLNNWFTSLTLDLAAVVALVVYSLRRHRLDDYHGHYRIWLWVAACWLWLSVDEAASLHESVQTTLREFAGQSLRETEMIWVGFYALVVGGITLRLVFELRSCISSLVALTISGVTFATALAAHFGFLPPNVAEYGVLIEEGCEMGGSLLLLFSMCLYARHVILDSQGLVAAKPAKAPKEAKAEAAAGRRSLWGRKEKVDQPHASVRPSSKRSDLDSVEAKAHNDNEDEDDEDEDGEGNADSGHDVHNLSKSERKALRRQQEKQRKTRLG
ncbi:MAG TPA: hypothetical protein VGG64_08730 [Pirellulales bacterium]|jgi:hypothetical protein